MAFRNKEIANPRAGQYIKFIQTARETHGALLEMESTYRSFSEEPPAHYHPYQAEDFRVITGELTVKIDGAQRTLKAGDTLHVSPGVVHAMWNASTFATVVHWKVRPALDTEHLLETVMGLAANGKTNARGVPSLLQSALLMTKFSDVFRLASPPLLVQRIVFGALLPVSYLLGFRATYKQYLD